VRAKVTLVIAELRKGETEGLKRIERSPGAERIRRNSVSDDMSNNMSTDHSRELTGNPG